MTCKAGWNSTSPCKLWCLQRASEMFVRSVWTSNHPIWTHLPFLRIGFYFFNSIGLQVRVLFLTFLALPFLLTWHKEVFLLQSQETFLWEKNNIFQASFHLSTIFLAFSSSPCWASDIKSRMDIQKVFYKKNKAFSSTKEQYFEKAII